MIVALFTRAWIEIIPLLDTAVLHLVALFTRAWIEITPQAYLDIDFPCRPLHEGVD